MLKQFIFIFFCSIYFGIFAQPPKILNIDVDYNGQNIVITYDIVATSNTEKFNISPEIYKSNGTKISAYIFNGDLYTVNTGTQKKIFWDFKKDGVELDNQISVKLTASAQPNIPMGKHLLKSAIYPGRGDYGLRSKYGNYWIYGTAFYGCLGVSTIFGLSSLSSYNKYAGATTSDAASGFLSSAISKRNVAVSFLGTAAVIWALDMIFIVKRVNKIKHTPASYPFIDYTKEIKSIVAFSPQRYINTKAPIQPPYLAINKLEFVDFDKNKSINANEETEIKFTIENKGKGDATNVSIKIQIEKPIVGLEFNSEKRIGNIVKGNSVDIQIPVKGNMSIITSEAIFKIFVKEANGFDADPIEITIPTREFVAPKVEISDFVFTTEGGGQAKLGVPINLKVIIQNTGQGIAKDVSVYFNFPENVFKTNSNSFTIGELKANESKDVNFEFFANKQFKEVQIPISAKLTESWGKYAANKTMEVKVNQDLKKTQVKLIADEQQKTEISIKTLKSDVDINIPIASEKKLNCYAVIIGNEDYSSHQTGLNNESNVDFAKNDAQVFKEYLVNTLGIPDKNITLLLDASSGQINQTVSKLSTLAEVNNGEAELIFFYAGHGLPDEKTKEPYIIPVDVNGSNLQYAIKLNEIFRQLTLNPSKRVIVFLDACFSGGARNQGLVAERGVKVKPKDDILKGNTIVFASSSGDESSGSYKEKQHGMFTYFLLKKLQESKGIISIKELFDYVETNVKKESVVANNKKQSPKISFSSEIINIWEKWNIK